MSRISINLRTKLYFIYGFTVVVVLLASLSGFWQWSLGIEGFKRVVNIDMGNERQLQLLRLDLDAQGQAWRDLQLAASNAQPVDLYWQQIEALTSKIEGNAGGLLKQLTDAKTQTLISKFIHSHQQLANSYQAAFDELNYHGVDGVMGNQSVVDVERKSEQLLVQAASELASSLNHSMRAMVDSGTNTIATYLAIIVGVSLVTSTVYIVYIQRRLFRRIARLAEDLSRLVAGDFSSSVVDASDDELGKIARNVRDVQQKLADLISNLRESTTGLVASAQAVSEISEQNGSGIRQRRLETDQVAMAMNQMAATVHEVARNTAEAAEAAQKADEETNNGRSVVTQAIEKIDALASEVEKSASVMQKLAADSENIGTVLDVIRGIAEQTNLLALNAAIEAARAGEHGRGFAVVADEVRTLAQRTQQSTQKIQEMIERLQAGANEAVRVMEEGRVQARASVEYAAKAGTSLEIITYGVTTITDMNAQIANAAEQQGAVAEEISRNILDITKAVEQAALGSEQTAVSSHELAQLAMNLQAMVGQYKS